MKKHLFLFILTLAVLSVSNVWAGKQYIFPVTSASSYSGTLSTDANGCWYVEMSNNGSHYVDIPFTWDESSTECLIKIGYTASSEGAELQLRFYRGGSDIGSWGSFGSLGTPSAITEKNCGALLTTSYINGCKQYSLRIRPADGKTMRVYYLKLETNNDATQPTANITSGLDFVATTTTGDQIITNSDFLYSHKKEDRVKTQNKEGYDRTTFSNGYVTAASRKLYTFETGTYKFTLQVFTEESNTYNKPYVFVNNVVAGGGSFYFNKDDASAGGKYRNWEIEIDVTAGTYPIAFYFPSVNEKLFYRLASVEKMAVSCSSYSFHYGTDNVSDWTIACFTYSGAGAVYYVNDFTIPDKPNYYVGNQGSFYNSNLGYGWGSNNGPSRSHIDAWSDLPFSASQGDGSGTRPKVGAATGATGKIKVYDNSTWNNMFISFEPDAYVLKFGSTEYPIELDNGNDYRSDVVEYNSTSASYTVSVGIADASGNYISTDNTQEMRHVFFVPSDAWKTRNAKFAIHYWGAGDARTGFMTAVPGKTGWYEGWLPAGATGFQFERQDPAGSEPTEKNRWTAGEDQTLQSGKNCYTMTATGNDNWDGAVTVSLYSTKGKFRMWDNSTSKNWFVHFYPYNVLTYDANGGSGAPDEQSVAIDAVSKSVTVAAGSGMTAPTGYEFNHWDTRVGDDGTDYAAGASYTLSADATLYAQWSPLSYDVTLNTNDGTINAGDVTSYTYGVGATLPTNVTKTGYNFGGWYNNSGLTGDAVASISSSETGDKEYWAKWTAKQTTITINANTSYHGSSTPGTVTATWGQALPEFTAASGVSGWSLEGYYTGANDGTKVINADGTLVQNVTGYTSNDATPVWIYETSTLDLYPHYEEMTTYSVTVNRNNDSYGTVTGASSYAEDATVNISATPAGGYEFVNWTTSDGVSFANANSASTSFTMIASDVTVQANFRAETCEEGYSLEVEDDFVFVTPGGGARSTPQEKGWYNSEWYTGFHGNGFFDMKNVSGEIYLPIHVNGGTYSFTIYNINGNNKRLRIYSKTSTSYTTITYGDATYYRTSSDGYTVTGSDNSGGQGSAFVSCLIENVALSAGDYIIGLKSDGWASWDQVVITNSTTYTVTYNATGAATGSTISAVDESSSAVSSGSSVSACTEVTFTATPASGCVVEHWQVNGVTYPAADGLTDFTLAINRNVTVTYTTTEASTYSVSVNRNNDSYGTVTGADTYTAGETVTITATPESGYGFVNWTTNDGVTFADATAAETTFTMPSKNVAVQANFAPLRTVSYEVVGDNGTVACAAVSSGGNVVSGRTLTFTATPDAGYSVLGWYTYDGASETLQANTRAQNSFNYTISSNITIRVKFTKIRIATGDANLGSTDGYANSNDGSTIATSNVDDPEGKFNHKVLQVDYKMVSASDQASYRGISLPVDNGYTASIASGKAGMGFWYRTESTTDKVLTYFCIGGTDGSNQFENLLPATNGEWQYWYIATDKVDDNTTFGFYINGTKNSKSTGTINANAKFWLSEVEPITPADVTVLGDETKEIAPVVEDLVIYQGGEVTNSEDVIVTGSIAYHRHAKGGALTNKLDQWYTFAVPFTVSGIEVKESSTWYAINAVHYTTNGDQSSEPDGPGHFYLQYLKNDTKNQMTNDRWMYINPAHSEYIDADTEDWDGYRYGYPKKDSAYIILFDSTDPIGNYFETNTEIRFVGGPQTIASTAWTPEYDTKETEYWMYPNNTLHSITLTNDAYVLNSDGTMFVLEEEPTIRPFECYIQATEAFKKVVASIPMRRQGGDTPTAIEDIELNDTSRTIKVLHQGHLIIIRNGQSYNLMGARVH